MTRVRDEDGKVYFSKWFDVQCGVIQGDIINPVPVLFILTLDQLVQHSTETKVVKIINKSVYSGRKDAKSALRRNKT